MGDVVKMQQQMPEKDSFDEFWLFYPSVRRVQKALCRAKWNAITGPGLHTRMLDKDSGQFVDIFLQATPREIIDGAKRYADKMRDPNGKYGSYIDGGKYVVSPAVFLNQGRWED